MTLPEFALSLYLAKSVLGGKDLPPGLPDHVQAEIIRAGRSWVSYNQKNSGTFQPVISSSGMPPNSSGGVSMQPQMNTPRFNSPQFNTPQMGTQSSSMPRSRSFTNQPVATSYLSNTITALAAPSYMPAGPGNVSSGPSYSSVSQQASYQSNTQPSYPQSSHTYPPSSSQPGYPPSSQTYSPLTSHTFNAPPAPAAQPVTTLSAFSQLTFGPRSKRDDWAITPEQKQYYDSVFREYDKANTGFISGDTARAIFLQSGLSPTVLARVW